MALIVNLTNNSKRWFVGGKKLQNSGHLDRHHLWRSHDPTSVQNFDFCEEKSDYPPFFIFNSPKAFGEF